MYLERKQPLKQKLEKVKEEEKEGVMMMQHKPKWVEEELSE